MFVFCLKPTSLPHKYLSVIAAKDNNVTTLNLTVKDTLNNDTIYFTNANSYSKEKLIQHENSTIFNPNTNGFLIKDSHVDSFGASEAYISTAIAPKDAPRFIFKETNTSSNEYYISMEFGNQTFVLSYDRKSDRVYLSNSPKYIDEKAWFAEFFNLT